MKGVLLENLTWVEAERVLTPDAIVVVPLGAAAKEHGPHLPLCNDLLISDHLKRRVLQAAEVIVAPTVGYHYYPAFVEYPGSVTLRLETARDLIEDICSSLATFGPRRFYVLNTGVSTLQALAPASDALATRGVLLRYTDVLTVAGAQVRLLEQQAGGTHADEIETSIMLYIAPDKVDMARAARDYHPNQGRLTRQPDSGGTYSATGIYGDATLATWAKGRAVIEAMVEGILADIHRVRSEPLPSSVG